MYMWCAERQEIEMSSYVIGVDVGGTNTDAVVLCDRTVVAAAKRPTTQDKTSGIVNAISAALESLSEEERARVLASVSRVSIGTTHFTNAVAERDAARLARVAVIRLCGSASRALPPYIDFPEDLLQIIYGGTHMVSGGLQYNGRLISAIDEEELKGTVREILKQDPPVRNVAILGIFSPRDDPLEGQEARAAKIVQSECAEISCTLSHALGLLGLLERENACILNESLKPLAKTTIAAFRQALNELGLTCPFYLTQNDGTLISAEEATKYPVLTFSSGPTNSMRGGAFLSGLRDAIVVDIGGTTTDVGVLKDGFPREASSQLKVGGVRTNFCMPDVRSIALGGGSHVKWDAKTGNVTVGPSSVGYRLTSEALCFGGQQCTTTDVAIAAGVAPRTICTTEDALASLQPAMVYATMREIRRKVEAVIDSMKVEREDVLVLLVGGGSVLMDQSMSLSGASRVTTPEKYSGVANAVGAALGTVGGSSDYIEDLGIIKKELQKEDEGVEEGDQLDKMAREVAEQRGIERAKREAIRKGAIAETIYIHSKSIADITYVTGCVRVKVKAIGDLTASGSLSPPDKNPPAPTDTGEPVQQQRKVEDNPFWPNSSAEDSRKDEAAGLPKPTVKDHIWVLSHHDVECLAIGTGILGCGGGGDPNMGRLMALQLLEQGKEIQIFNPFRMQSSEMGLLCAMAIMGAPAVLNEKLVTSFETTIALRQLEKVLASGVCEVDEGRSGNEQVAVTCRTLFTGEKVWVADQAGLKNIDTGPTANIPLNRRITGLICAEAGGVNSFEPLLVAAHTGLPVLDVDGMGRAFPELQMFCPYIYGLKPYPAAVTDDKGETILCTHADGAKLLENFFRTECVRMGMVTGVTFGGMTMSEVKEKCIFFTMSQAWQLGRAVLRAQHTHTNVLDAIKDQQKGTILITGKVLSVDCISEAGFSRLVAVVEGLEDYAGALIKIYAKNENYIAQELEKSGSKLVDGVVLASTPDLICVIDSDTGYPITTESIRYGMRVGVLALPANPKLLTPEAMKVVGPQAFGFNVPYTPPRPLPKRSN